jgi:hypothetical protein
MNTEITNSVDASGEKAQYDSSAKRLLSSELKEQAKLDIIEQEYDIPVSSDFREDVSVMCNLGEGVEEKATKRTTEKFIMGMYKQGCSLDLIAKVAGISIDEVKDIIKKMEPAMA